ncbi:MAG: SDR family NAD(P)-dependent oxidoreductase [Janthinobacterium lividum]
MAEKLAVVTGASSGIGFNLAKVFAENGFDLVIDAEDASVNKAATELKALGVQVTPVVADLATYDGCKKFWQAVEAADRKVDAVAINAGIGVGGLFADTDLDQEINLVRLNVESTVHIAKYAVRKLVTQKDGKILITSSIAGEMVAPKEAVYAASKAFDLSFGKSLRHELKDTGVSVTILQPGPTDTNFFNRADMGDTKAGTSGKKDSEPYDVAKQGFRALMAGDEHVYAASLMTKVEGALMGMVPDSLVAKMHEKMTEPASK